MRPILEQPEFDVVIIGSGIAGALVAHRLAKAKHRVLILEAGGVPPDALGRWAMVHNFTSSPSKAPDSPFCGDDVLPIDPSVDPKKDPGKYRFLQPSPIEELSSGKNYYDYDAEAVAKKRYFKSHYERVVGGSTWHWQGIYIRMLPNDFKMKSLYGVGLDWPISYRDLEPWYVQAEYEMGVAGDDKENREYYERKFGAYRSKPYPMQALVPSYLDKEIARAINGKPVPKYDLQLQVNTVPHAINSRSYDGRPACEGYTSCVPLCPIKARYEAIVHVEKALRAGAVLRTQAIVTKIDVDNEKKWITRVWYKQPGAEENRASGRIVVLAANGIENPRILLSSNAANSSDKVGRYLMDHPIKQSFALAPEPVYPFRGPQTTSDIAVFRDGPHRRRYAAFKTSIKNDGWSTTKTGAPRGNAVPPKDPNPNANGSILDFVENWGYFGSTLRNKLRDHGLRQITLNSACEQLPLETNRVTLSNNKDGLGIPRPFIQYRLDNDDYVRGSFKTIVDVHDFIFTQLKATDRVLQADPPPPDQLTYGGSGHIMGTTVMGADPKTSVVDRNCKAHDHPNLFVIGSSVFPTGSTANPTSTVAALALRAADFMDKQLKS